MKPKYYLIFVWGDVEPYIRGPYKTRNARDTAALELRREEGIRHGIFWMDTLNGNDPVIGSYSPEEFLLDKPRENQTAKL